MARFFRSSLLLTSFSAVLLAFTSWNTFGVSALSSGEDVIERDLCIIGGGSAGTYSAIRMRDQGKSVVVVEKKGRMGGHTETFTDPATGLTTDAGVIVFHNLTIATDYFARFNIPLTTRNVSMNAQYIDLRTGESVPYTPQDPTEAFAAYAAQLAKYPFLDTGFNLPDPVPEELLIPFRDFAAKYNLGPIMGTIWSISQGIGDLLSQPTLYVMKVFGKDILRSIQVGFLTTKNHDNSELYEKATAELGDDVLLNSHVIYTSREGAGVEVEVETPLGRKLIRAKKLLIAIPPKIENLQGFDLDETEREIFEQFSNNAYYTLVLKGSNIPPAVNNARADLPYLLPKLPDVYTVEKSEIPNYYHVKYGSPYEVSDEQVKQTVLTEVARLQDLESQHKGHDELEIAFYSNHSPTFLAFSPSAIADGFYDRLNGLQGHLNTFYTGATFETLDSTLIWRFTETILPRIFDER
ncbi:hypothetical protein AJ80_09083 [Polytolypa hystricis UAMH7299]|uniref:Amine oxidase domain-containing protein n=1 Tax=Polytolypa hystricis (strain UAMH7299) TaxID=1447883 RepID=A0A2B7WWR2_POLH7|nr:hypothetical protein AJ80_09083 [Polytolypa hystricis UAMH7299]